MSSVLVEPNQFSSHTSAMIRSRVTTSPGFAHQQREQVELLGRQLELLARRARRAARARSTRTSAASQLASAVDAAQLRAHAGQQLGERGTAW